MQKRSWFAPIFALLLLGLLVWGLGRLVRPKYASGITLEGSMVENWYAHKDQDHQVLFIGDCEVYESFSPVTLFNEFGATSYIRGSAQQLMWQSYYLLREALKTQAPRAVVLSICSLRYAEPQSEAYNRMTLDGMRLSREKFEAVRASLTEGESELSYYVPLWAGRNSRPSEPPSCQRKASSATTCPCSGITIGSSSSRGRTPGTCSRGRSSPTTATSCGRSRCPTPGCRRHRCSRTQGSGRSRWPISTG